MKSLSQFEQIDLESASKTQMADMVRALLKRANKDAQEIQRKTVELQSKEDKIQTLTYELSYLRRIRYGAKTEAFSQLQKDLFEESLDEDLAATEAALEALSDSESADSAHKPKRPRAGRQSLPEHLPRIEFLLAAMKERAKLADIDDETRSNILVNKKGAMISPFFIDQINIKMAARSRTRCFCRPSHPMGRYPDLHASVP